VITGYWFLDVQSEWAPPPELAHFLKAGPPPVYIGFGSPGTRQPLEIVASVVSALETHRLRGVLALAGEVENLMLPDTILPIAEAPHAWLFPRMAAVVHHGGAGTTAASLRAGVPTLVTPLAVDQFFWGQRVEALGVGPRPIPQRSLSAARLAQALGQATQDEAMQARAQALGQAIQAEDGVQRAVETIRSMT
jgi:sterol 3beta-glucosyltransferase